MDLPTNSAALREQKYYKKQKKERDMNRVNVWVPSAYRQYLIRFATLLREPDLTEHESAAKKQILDHLNSIELDD